MCGSTTDRAGTVEGASAEPVEQAVTVPPPQGLDHRADAWAGQLAAALSSALTPSEVLDVLADLGRPLLRAETIDISVLDATGRTLQLVASRRSPEDVERRFASYPVDAPLPTRDALVRRQPVLIPTTRDRDQRYPALRDVVLDQKAWAVLPLICADRVLGTVGLGWTSHQSFPPDQITACTHVAQLCAAALDRAACSWS